jgi:hypothetical protein
VLLERVAEDENRLLATVGLSGSEITVRTHTEAGSTTCWTSCARRSPAARS